MIPSKLSSVHGWSNSTGDRKTDSKQERTPQHTNLDDITRQLHTLSQCWYIHFRNLSDFEASVRFIHSASRRYSKLSHQQRIKQQSVAVMDRALELEESLRYLSSSCQSLRHLVTDYRGRTNIQINLVRTLRLKHVVFNTDRTFSYSILQTKQKVEPIRK